MVGEPVRSKPQWRWYDRLPASTKVLQARQVVERANPGACNQKRRGLGVLETSGSVEVASGAAASGSNSIHCRLFEGGTNVSQLDDDAEAVPDALLPRGVHGPGHARGVW